MSIAVVILLLAPWLLASQRQDVTLWVTLGDSDQLVEVDAYTFKEIRRITTDPKPHGLAASRDGSRLESNRERSTLRKKSTGSKR